MGTRIGYGVWCLVLMMGVTVGVQGADVGTGAGLWAGHAMPILNKYCTECHGSPKRKSGLDLRTLEAVMAGGDDGAVVVAGKPNESTLYLMLDADADSHMPPKEKQLTVDEIALLGSWIESMGGEKRGGKVWAKPGEGAVLGSKVVERSEWSVPAGVSPTLAIDVLIEAGWEARGVEPSDRWGDGVFVRRVYLDLAGRIPTAAEAKRFLASTASNKRAELVERLLGSVDYARHFRDVFDATLMGLPTEEFANKVASDLGSLEASEKIDAPGMTPGVWLDRQRGKYDWLGYLEDVFGKNRAWDEVVREILMARPTDEASRGANWFLFERADDYEAITDAVATGFFGVQVECAQCHDHPLAAEIYQGHYWGLNAIFSRSKNQMSSAGPGVGESAIGGFVRYTNTEGESYDATLNFLGGGSIEQKRVLGKDGKEKDSPSDYRVARDEGKGVSKEVVEPKYSRRAVGVKAIVDGNPLIGKAFVNRIWALLMGRGIVHPVDMMDSVHPPSHPELLDWLARDFADHGYDIKRLVKSIVLSRAYQLDGRRSAKPGLASDFAKSLEKPLTAEAYYRSLFVATTEGAPDGGLMTPLELREVFGGPFPEVSTTTLSEAMFLTNSELMGQVLIGAEAPGGSVLEGGASTDEFIGKTYRRVLGRAPDGEELEKVSDYLSARVDRPADAYRQWLWAMMTGAEFRINH